MDCRNFEHDITREFNPMHGRPTDRLTGEDDSVALVIWTFTEPVAIIVAASVPILRKLFEKPAQAARERERMGARAGRGIPPSDSFPLTARLGGQANTCTITGGPLDSSIALQTLGARDSIVRTDEVDIRIEEINPDARRRAAEATRASRPGGL
jgi:hypothetical protein